MMSIFLPKSKSMKNFIALSLLFFVSLTLFGQGYQGVRDNRYRGVVIYEALILMAHERYLTLVI